jgi:hypothetical protein
MTELRVPLVITEPLTEGRPALRVPLIVTEPLTEGAPNLRSPLVITEPLTEGRPNLRVSLFFIETLIPVQPEEIMVTATLPGFGNSTIDPTRPAALDRPPLMRGLTFPVGMTPQFSTRVSQSAALNSTRLALADYPNWAFELTFSFLEDYSGDDSSLRQMEGAFCTAGGRARPFLFKSPDFYTATNVALATADGGTLQFDFMRAIGSYREPVGQVDTANTITVYGAVDESHSVPGTGPYTVTVTHAAAFIADEGVTIGGTPLTKVAGTPSTGQYAVAAGVYTFNAAQAGAAATISYRYTINPADYTVTMPNKLLFGSAPEDGTLLSWDGQYFFTCFFEDDMLDFSKFAATLWELKSLKFHSELLA